MSEKIEIDEHVSRRSFIKILIGVFNGLIALALAIPGLGYLLTPVFKKGSGAWVSLGAQVKLQSETPQKAVFTYISESGYSRQEKDGFVWVLRKPDDDFVVYSPVCSHTGCNVAWEHGQNAFVCPCHNGTYDIDGNVVSGPPPKPLQKLPAKIENDQVFIQLNA